MKTKTTFEIKKKHKTYCVEDNGNIILQGFPTQEMALHGLWAYMGKKRESFYHCDEDGKVFIESEEII